MELGVHAGEWSALPCGSVSSKHSATSKQHSAVCVSVHTMEPFANLLQ